MEAKKRKKLINKFADLLDGLSYADAVELIECMLIAVLKMSSEKAGCEKAKIQSAFEIFKENVQEQIDKL